MNLHRFSAYALRPWKESALRRLPPAQIRSPIAPKGEGQHLSKSWETSSRRGKPATHPERTPAVTGVLVEVAFAKGPGAPQQRMGCHGTATKQSKSEDPVSQ
jgi:hypothetical protein